MNLYQPQQATAGEKAESTVDKGILISLGLLAVVGAVFFGVRFYLGSLDKQAAAAEENRKVAIESLSNNDVAEVASFDERLKNINNRLKLSLNQVTTEDNANDALAKVESAMVDGVTLDSFTYSGKLFKLVLVSPKANGQKQFETLAKQIQSLKDLEIAADLKVVDTKRATNGDVEMAVELKLPKETKK